METKIKNESVKIYPLGFKAEQGGVRTVKYLDGNLYYYVGYRARVGADQDLSTRSEFADAISIHSIPTNGKKETNVIDTLKDGGSWRSPNGKLRVTVEKGADNTHKILQISLSDGQSVDPIVIRKQPLSQTVTTGENVTIVVEAEGSSLKYQWFKDGVALAGETSKILQINNFTSANTGSYKVEITDSIQQLYSDAAFIKTEADKPLTILADLKDREVSVGKDITLTVTAQGTGVLNYEWEKDGVTINGESSNDLKLTNLSKDDSGIYQVTISDSSKSIESRKARVTVTEEGKWKVVSISLVTPKNRDGEDFESYDLVLTYKGAKSEKTCRIVAPDTELVCEFDVEVDLFNKSTPVEISLVKK